MKRFVPKDFSFVRNISYVCFLLIGYYFIHQGNIWQKYHDQKTFFSEYQEPLSEMPVIIARVEKSHGRLTIGIDYNITYCTRFSTGFSPSSCKDLKIGENRIRKDLDLRLEVKKNVNRISTMNPMSPISSGHGLIFNFRKKDTSTVVEIILTNRNNSYCGNGYMFHDGERYEI